MKNHFTNELGVPKGYKATHVLEDETVNPEYVYVGFRVDEATETVLDVKWWVNLPDVKKADWAAASYTAIGQPFTDARQLFLTLLA